MPTQSLTAELPMPTTKQRPSFRWSDIWRAPLHDFPIRDEILYQFLPFSSDMRVLEIGPGSGFTAFRLARQVQQLTLVDVAAEVLAHLARQLAPIKNISMVCADMSQPCVAERLGRNFAAAYALDVFEYVKDPAVCLRNLADVLRPGGTLFISFPNMPPPKGDGVTYFSRRAEIERLLQQAGFRSWQIFAVSLRPWAAGVYHLMHEWPMGVLRRLRKGNGTLLPQTYEATWAFQHQQRLHRYKAALNLLWSGIAPLMRASGEVFRALPLRNEILDQQLVIRARKR